MPQAIQFDPADESALQRGMAELDMISPIITAGFSYWNERRAGRALPLREDFDPVIDIPRLLPNIIMLDVRFEPLDFRFRLVGSRVRKNLSRDYVGKWFSQLDNFNQQSSLWSRHQAVAEKAQPMLQRPTYIGPYRDFIAVENIMLPVTVEQPGWALQMMFFDFVRRKFEDDNSFINV